VREALLILKQEGLIATRRGRAGGSVVARPDHEALVSSIDIFLRSHISDPENSTVLEAREAIEPWSASLAAHRRTPEDLDSLDRFTNEMEEAPSLQDYLTANLEWHVAVARASRNVILLSFMNALGRALYAQTDSVEFNTADVRATAVHAHRIVNDAIRAGDSAAAQRRMARHIHVYGDAILQHPPATEG
jgi:DNA-binding FadR family transcriptional regulator